MLTETLAFAKTHNDAINGCFEIIAAGLNCLSIKALLKSRALAGIHWAPTALFFIWGLWNTVFYPVNHLWFSFYCGLIIVCTNATWLWLVFWYWLEGRAEADLVKHRAF